MQALEKADEKYPKKNTQTRVLKIYTLEMSDENTRAFNIDTSQKTLVKFGPRYAQQMGCCRFVPPSLA